MRISSYQQAQDAALNVQSSLSQVQNLTEEMSTGLAVNLPSDNPGAAGQIVDIQSELSDNTGYTSAAQNGGSQLTETASVLGQVQTILNNAQASALQGANSATMTQSDLDSLSSSVDSDLQQILALANTSQNGQSLFAGYQTSTQAFGTTTNAGGQITAVNYQGDDGINKAEVGDDLSMATNIPGNQVFDASGSSVFQSLIAIRDALSSGNQSNLQAGISQLESSMNTVSSATAQAGALGQDLTTQESSLSTMKTTLTSALGNVQDVDMATAATTYQEALNVYQAGIQATGMIGNLPSIVDFLPS